MTPRDDLPKLNGFCGRYPAAHRSKIEDIINRRVTDDYAAMGPDDAEEFTLLPLLCVRVAFNGNYGIWACTESPVHVKVRYGDVIQDAKVILASCCKPASMSSNSSSTATGPDSLVSGKHRRPGAKWSTVVAEFDGTGVDAGRYHKKPDDSGKVVGFSGGCVFEERKL